MTVRFRGPPPAETGAATESAHSAKKKRLNPPFLAPSFSVCPRQHSYSLGLITLSLLLQVSACVGLRGVEKILQILHLFFPFSASIPSWSSHRLWLLRVGYYKLTRPTAIAVGQLGKRPDSGSRAALGPFFV